MKIQGGIFKGDTLLPFLFVIDMMPLNNILRKYIDEYKLCKSQEKINHLMYMDDMKLFAQNKGELETLIQTVRIYSQDTGMEFGIEKCAMIIMKSGKRQNNKERPTKSSGCPRVVMVKAMDCGIVVSEVIFQSYYYVQFRAITLGKGMNSLVLPAMG